MSIYLAGMDFLECSCLPDTIPEILASATRAELEQKARTGRFSIDGI